MNKREKKKNRKPVNLQDKKSIRNSGNRHTKVFPTNHPMGRGGRRLKHLTLSVAFHGNLFLGSIQLATVIIKAPGNGIMGQKNQLPFLSTYLAFFRNYFIEFSTQLCEVYSHVEIRKIAT